MSVVFKNRLVRWIDHRLPIFSTMHHELYEYPVPRNLNYFWNFGFLAGFMLMVMIATGIVLAMHYTANTLLAFDSVEKNYARCELWMADPLYSYEWRLDVFYLGIYPHFPWDVLRVI